MSDELLVEATETEVELESLAHSIETDLMTVDTAFTTAATLESALEVLEQEDLTEERFQAQILSVESAMDISLEEYRPGCYQGTYSQEIADWAVKFVRGAIAKVWQAIKYMVGTIRRKIAEFFSKLLAGNSRMRKKAESLLKELKDLEKEGIDASKNPIDVPNGGRLRISGNIDPSDLQSAISDLANDLVPVLEYYNQENNKIVDELEKAVRLLEGISESSVEGFEQQVSKIRSMPGDLQSGLSRATRQLTRRKEYPGEQVLKMRDAVYESNGVPSKMPSIEFERAAKKVSYSETETVIPADFEEIRGLLDSSTKILESIEATEKQFKNLDQRMEKLVKQKDDIMGQSNVSNKIETLGIDSTVRVLMNFFQLVLPGSIAQVVKYEYGVARATVIFCEKSLAAHKKQR
jgi:archaellum component FlaC/uncharacterized protein YwgA